MSLEIVAGLLGSQLVRAVACDVATTIACQAVQHAVERLARPAPSTVVSDAARPERQAPLAPAAAPAPELRAMPTVEIVSAIPGRARLRIHGLRDDPTRAAQVVATVRAVDGVTTAEASALTGTLLVHFAANRTDVSEIVAALEPPRPTRPLRAAERAPYLHLLASNE